MTVRYDLVTGHGWVILKVHDLQVTCSGVEPIDRYHLLTGNEIQLIRGSVSSWYLVDDRLIQLHLKHQSRVQLELKYMTIYVNNEKK